MAELWPPTPMNNRAFRQGDLLVLGERSDGTTPWKGWLKCRLVGGRESASAWIPCQLIEEIAEGQGVLLEDYDSRELEVKAGDHVQALRSMAGWRWCRRSDGQEGWLPAEILERTIP